MLLVWLALAASLLAVVAVSTFTTARGIKLFRDVKRLGRSMGEEVAAIERGTAAIEGHLVAAAESSDALSRAVQRLNASRARLNVLLVAIDDVRERLRLVTAFLPRS
jgi:type IV secretory pathway protease TraF